MNAVAVKIGQFIGKNAGEVRVREEVQGIWTEELRVALLDGPMEIHSFERV